ncbi:Rho termination factor N-terminal domain-containing protein [Nostoc sp. FACHB-145]
MHEVEHKSDNEPSKQELYEQAKSLDIKNRSKMSKEELTQAIDQAQS